MRQVQQQRMQQKLSPRQIQLMRLLQMPVTDLETAIKEEVEKNPLLEAEARDEVPLPADDNRSDWDVDEDGEDEYEYDYREHLSADPNEQRREFVVSDRPSATERLIQQLSMRPLSERDMSIATEIVGTLDDAGYLSRDITLVANDMSFRRGIDTTPEEVERVLSIVQSCDPPGIGARTLRECLLLQLQRRIDEADGEEREKLKLAGEVVERYFDDFVNHRIERLCSALNVGTEDIEQASAIIRTLNPKPAGSESDDEADAAYVTPDIVLTQHDGNLQFFLNDSHLPLLSLNEYYTAMLREMEQQGGDKATVQFLRTKQNDAEEFIDLLRQRQETIERIMQYIVRHQKKFLLTGNTDHLVPMRQREVAEATGLDISTISRMANSKYIQTDFGILPLKECFSKGMQTEDGGEMSVETIKQKLSDAIDAEDKHAPLSDDALANMLKKDGLPIARRTVAKYREQMGIPVARLRRLIVVLVFLLTGSVVCAQNSYYDSIIAVRLKAAEKAEAAEKKKKATKAAVEKKAAEKKKKTPQLAKKDTANVKEIEVRAEEYIVPLWYDAFPGNRVNPLGRTCLDQLPDEINLRLVHDSADFCFPVRNVKTSPYGWRWHRGHHGVDIRLKTGEPVHAAFGGTVRVATRMGGYGLCVVLRHPNGLETLYGHLSKINVHHGQKVGVGEVIGLGGSTGNSTGPHLHFECRFLYQTFDPEWILDFEHFTLRTTRLHLDKTYFGIHQPRKGQTLDYKADQSHVRENTTKRKQQNHSINKKDF